MFISILSYIFVYVINIYLIVFFFFFFKQKTAYEMRISDWSSDVCSSDLKAARLPSSFLLIAEIVEAEKAWPHSPSVIALNLRVETPWTYISASVATSASHDRW